MAEAGGPPGLDVSSFVVLVALRSLPAAVGAKVAADVRQAIDEPDVKTRFEAFASGPIHWSPGEIARHAEAKSLVYGQLVRRGSISLE